MPSEVRSCSRSLVQNFSGYSSPSLPSSHYALVAQLNQNSLGAIVIGIGILGVLYALAMDTSNNGFVNFSLMQEQRNVLEISSLAVLAGIVLYGFGALSSNRAGASAGKCIAACPKCNGVLDGAPELCKYCRT